VVHLLCHVASSCDESFDIHPASRYTKAPANPTNRSLAPHVQASVRTQHTTQDKQWDCGRCRSHRLVPTHVSRGREGTCGHAIRRSWCLQNPSGSTSISRDDRLRSSDELPCGIGCAVFEGVYEGFKLFLSHANALSGCAPVIHGMCNFAQYLPGSGVGDAEISNY
jgi:hypothetical protein